MKYTYLTGMKNEKDIIFLPEIDRYIQIRAWVVQLIFQASIKGGDRNGAGVVYNRAFVQTISQDLKNYFLVDVARIHWVS